MGPREQRQLRRISERLRAARAELAAAEEQVVFLEEEEADARVRGLVSERPLDRRTAEDLRRTTDNARRHRDRLAAEVVRLATEADHLLDSTLSPRGLAKDGS